jgi:hypothetical protein
MPLFMPNDNNIALLLLCVTIVFRIVNQKRTVTVAYVEKQGCAIVKYAAGKRYRIFSRVPVITTGVQAPKP